MANAFSLHIYHSSSFNDNLYHRKSENDFLSELSYWFDYKWIEHMLYIATKMSPLATDSSKSVLHSTAPAPISHIMYWNHHDGAYGRCCGALMPTVDPNAATAAKADGSTTHISKVHFLFPLLSVSKSYRATITIHCLKYSHTLWRLCWLAKVLAATIALAHSS